MASEEYDEATPAPDASARGPAPTQDATGELLEAGPAAVDDKKLVVLTTEQGDGMQITACFGRSGGGVVRAPQSQIYIPAYACKCATVHQYITDVAALEQSRCWTRP
jgi:hypothetical protein